MEHDAKENAATSRSQHSVLTLPHDRGAVGQFLAGALERIDAGSHDVQLLVLTPDTETAAMVAAVTTDLAAPRGLRVVPATSAKRAGRLLREWQPQIVVGSSEEIVALIRASALKLDSLRTIVLAWVDEGAGGAGSAALETVMSELPKEAGRVLVASRLGPEARELAERYARRGLRTAEATADAELAPLALQYVSVSSSNRPSALRRLFDELDPASAVVWTRTPESESEASRAVAALGYRGDDVSVRVVRGGPLGEAGLLVLYDIPAAPAELRAALGQGTTVPQIVVLAQPRQIPLVRTLAAGGRVAPLTLSGPAGQARRREEGVRGELRETLERGLAARELLALEPLLESYDGIEIAAAALRLLEQERATRLVTQQPGADVVMAARSGPGPSGGTRIFMTVGERDGVRPGDLVGAIAGTAGITGQNVGKVEVHDTHSLVEIVGVDAGSVADKMTGASIKGRRVVARLERDRPPRDEGARGFGGSRERAPRGDRPERSARGERGERTGGFRGERGPRPDRGDRPTRPRRPREERGER
ncbi:MAG TPA: DbpA RNA binding domain-containing protein [Gemmatimonadaceae bacterium]|nr:DbpA RNA binding domain-containing protein [Gemmatimonadaceae bacterium]